MFNRIRKTWYILKTKPIPRGHQCQTCADIYQVIGVITDYLNREGRADLADKLLPVLDNLARSALGRETPHELLPFNLE